METYKKKIQDFMTFHKIKFVRSPKSGLNSQDLGEGGKIPPGVAKLAKKHNVGSHV